VKKNRERAGRQPGREPSKQAGRKRDNHSFRKA
jgi:hypothetical protein